MWVTGPHKPEAASVGGLFRYSPVGGVVGSPIAKNRLRLAFGGPTSSTRPRSARSRLSLFRELGPRHCKQRPRIERPLGLAAAVVGLRAVRLGALIKAVGIDLVHGRGNPKGSPLQF